AFARHLRYATVMAALVMLTGCGALLQTPYVQPETTVSARWEAPAPEVTAAIAVANPWWTNFGDANLNALVAEALRTNNDLAAAALRVRRAQPLAGLAERDL